MHRERALKILFVTLACCVAALSGPTEPKNSSLPSAAAKQQVLDLEKEWVTAEVKHDATTLR
jgi:hypothetical protein